MKRFSVLIIITLLLIFNCGKKEDKDVTIATKYLKNKGFHIVSYEGRAEEYELTADKLIQWPYMIHWGLQDESPDRYIGKIIYAEKFVVKNHPLDNWVQKSRFSTVKAKGKTNVLVFLVEHQPVGGISFPITDEPIFGSPWSIDGKTREEIHHIDFQNWRDEWITKYKSYQ